MNRILLLASCAWLAAACGQNSSSPSPTVTDASADAAEDATTDGTPSRDAAEDTTADTAVESSEASATDSGPALQDAGDDSTVADADADTGAADASIRDVAAEAAAPEEAAPPEASTDDAGLPSSEACLTGGHVFWVHGDPGCPWFTGTETDGPGAAFAVESEAYYATYDGAYVQVTPAEGGYSDGWWINFNTWQIKQPMLTGVVYDVAAVNEADIVQHGIGCPGNVSGYFRIDEFSASGGEGGVGTLEGLTAVFVFKCENVIGELHGCVHY